MLEGAERRLNKWIRQLELSADPTEKTGAATYTRIRGAMRVYCTDSSISIPLLPLSTDSLVAMAHHIFFQRQEVQWDTKSRQELLEGADTIRLRANKRYKKVLAGMDEEFRTAFMMPLISHPAWDALLSAPDDLMKRYAVGIVLTY